MRPKAKANLEPKGGKTETETETETDTERCTARPTTRTPSRTRRERERERDKERERERCLQREMSTERDKERDREGGKVRCSGAPAAAPRPAGQGEGGREDAALLDTCNHHHVKCTSRGATQPREVKSREWPLQTSVFLEFSRIFIIEICI